jgi:hypothetical protein
VLTMTREMPTRHRFHVGTEWEVHPTLAERRVDVEVASQSAATNINSAPFAARPIVTMHICILSTHLAALHESGSGTG